MRGSRRDLRDSQGWIPAPRLQCTAKQNGRIDPSGRPQEIFTVVGKTGLLLLLAMVDHPYRFALGAG